eukprot:98950_1
MMTAYINHNKYDQIIHLYDQYIASQMCSATAYRKLGNIDKANEIRSKYIPKYSEQQRASNIRKLHGRKATKIDLQLMHHLNRKEYRELLDVYCNTSDANKNYMTHSLGIKACTALNDFKTGKQIHNDIQTKHGFLYENMVEIKTSLIHFYGKCSSNTAHAVDIFNSIEKKDIVCIGAMMNVYIRHNKCQSALALYDEIETMDLKSKRTAKKEMATHKIAIKACAHLEYGLKGKKIHTQLIMDKNTKHWFYRDISIANALINMYGVCKEIDDAKRVFDSIPSEQRDIITIGCMMTAYLKNEEYTECLRLLMNTRHSKLDIICYVTALNACVASHNVSFAQHLVDRLKARRENHFLDDIRIQSLMKQIEQNTSKKNKYQINNMVKMKRIFNSHLDKDKDIDLVHAMMNAYINDGWYQKAWHVYCKIGNEYNAAVKNKMSYSMAIKLCTALMDLEKGKSIHYECQRLAHFNTDPDWIVFKNSLITFYTIKACLRFKHYEKGLKIHNDAMDRNIQSVELNNAWIGFYGCCNMDKALEIFNTMHDDEKNIYTIGATMRVCIKYDLNQKALDLYDAI